MLTIFSRLAPAAVASSFVLLALMTMASRCAAAETQNFDSEVAAAAFGWIGENNRNPSFGTDFGFSDTNSAGGASGAGEAGGAVPRRNATSPGAYYGDISIGTFTLADRLEASGRIAFFTENLDGGIRVGWFNTELPSFAGIQVAEGNRYQAQLRLDNNTGSGSPLQSGAPSEVSELFSLLWDPLTSVLTTTIGEFTNTATLTAEQLDIGATFNAFGITTSGASSDLPDRRGRLFIDDVTYTSVNPPSLEMRVNRFSGATRIVGVGGTGSLALNSYSAGSNAANPPLENVWVPGNWNSITDQEGGGWQEVDSDQQQIGESNQTGSKMVAAGAEISLGNVYNTADTERDISFSYGLAGDDATKVGNVVFDGGLHLQIDKSTGEVTIVNDEPVGINFDGYVIQSAGASLNEVAWNSLQNQSVSGWEAIESSNSSALSEVNLESSTLLASDGGSRSLGTVYAGGAGGPEDLTFTYSLGDGVEVLSGAVEYVSGGDLSGDYDDSGLVSQGDLDLVLLNWGDAVPPTPTGWTNQVPTDGLVSQNELDGVLLNWGDSAGAGSLVSGAVPEPTGVSLLLIGFAVIAAKAFPQRESRC